MCLIYSFILRDCQLYAKHKGGTTNLKVGEGGNTLEGGGQYSQNTKIWKMWVVHDPPPQLL